MEAVLPPPLPFSFTNNLENVTSGNLSKEWEKWRKSFQVYYEACELSKKSAQVQMSILLHVIGEQCREVHAQFEGTFASLKDLLDKFESFFSPKKNITIERHRFFTRCQKQSESIEQYAFELKKLASACEFKELIDDLIRDRLICGIQENVLRERLLREPDLTLKKSLEICNIAQISKVQAGSIKKESSEHEAYTYNITASNSQDQFMLEEGGIPYGQVNWISRRGGYGARGAPRGRGRGWSQPAPRPAPPRRRAAPAQTAVSSREMRQQRQQTGPYGEIKSGVQCLKCGFAHDTLSRAVEPTRGPVEVPRDQLDLQAQVCAIAVSNPLLDTHFVKIQVATQNDVEIQTVLSDNAVTSSSGVAGAPRALDTGFDSRDTVAHPGPSSILSAPTNNNSNNYVTRSGREVIVPDRWGSWGW
ncbi:uncharacterized protein LOC134802967 [Cydia splendana]|uniref:uncharacterized protein LOC134802967 n=1 Tax=Cydia splendana TaxID=1100963 RepID=UPI00300CAB00